MGLDTSHDCWSGPYSMFMRWRTWLAKQIGLPLGLMRGFYEWEWEDNDLDFSRHYNSIVNADRECGRMYWKTLCGMEGLGKPIRWPSEEQEPLVLLLHHSDCDGRLRWFDCKRLAIRLGKVLREAEDDSSLPMLSNSGEVLWTNWRDGRGCYDGMTPATERFIRGLLKAWKAREDVIFR